MASFKTYYRLTKPGIIYGNALTALAGFLLASKRHIDFWNLLAMLVGTSLVIASACVFNNYIDRDIDKLMARTKKRALASGSISVSSSMVYASVLGTLGFLVLGIFTNHLTLLLGLIGFIFYVIFYGIAKRRSVHGTVVGSVAGAIPPLAGYTAATNRIDAGAILLFLILVFWQMPHFYAIAIRRFNDYKSAGLPVLPVKKGVKAAKLQITLYIVGFIAATTALSLKGYTGIAFLIVMAGLGLWWFYKSLEGFKAKNDEFWARNMFLFSLVVTLALSIMLSINAWLP